MAKLFGFEEFKKFKTPMCDGYHTELDETQLVEPERITKYRSKIGS